MKTSNLKVATLVLLIVFALILTYTNISETVISPVIMVITAISILIGSSIVNMKIKRNGLVNGGIIGGIYILTIHFSHLSIKTFRQIMTYTKSLAKLTLLK